MITAILLLTAWLVAGLAYLAYDYYRQEIAPREQLAPALPCSACAEADTVVYPMGDIIEALWAQEKADHANLLGRVDLLLAAA